MSSIAIELFAREWILRQSQRKLQSSDGEHEPKIGIGLSVGSLCPYGMHTCLLPILIQLPCGIAFELQRRLCIHESKRVGARVDGITPLRLQRDGNLVQCTFLWEAYGREMLLRLLLQQSCSL